MILLQILGTAAGLVILARAVGVIAGMDMRARTEHYLAWLGFGLAYAALAAAAAASVIALWTGGADLGTFAWLGASAGLILFDRRRGRRQSRPSLA